MEIGGVSPVATSAQPVDAASRRSSPPARDAGEEADVFNSKAPSASVTAVAVVGPVRVT